jgi:subtilisin family serine protease
MEEEELNFEVVDHQGKPVRANVHVVCRDMGGETFEVDGTSGPDGGVTLSVPPMSRLEYVVVQAEGFWTFHSKEAEDFETLRLIRLPELDRAAWWLQALGIDATDTGRGYGIKVAVIDADFRLGAGLDDVSGGEEAAVAGDTQSWGQSWGHGEMVCRILCDRQPSSMAYFSAAPGADVVFADATGKEGGVDPAMAISAILKLVSQDEVDVISLSWGDREELAGLRNVIKFASDMGVTIVAASGNDASEPQPLFPARSPNCIGVGAFGSCGWGPTGTMAGWYDNQERKELGKVPDFGPIFAWSDCTFGNGIDAIGPGVGILVQRDNSVSFDLSGTSFAAPLVAGALAIALSKDKQYLSLPRTSARTKYARRAFQAICRPTGLPPSREGFGVPIIPRGQ